MRSKKLRGFTLVELMVTVAVAAVLFAVAAPQVRAFISAYRLRTATNELAASLAYARSESIKRGWSVTLCKSANAAAAQPSCSAAGTTTWQQGWLIFVDYNDDRALSTAAPVDELLRVVVPQASDMNITTTNGAYVAYKSTGAAIAGSANQAPGNFVICLDGESRTVELSATGHTDVTVGSC